MCAMSRSTAGKMTRCESTWWQGISSQPLIRCARKSGHAVVAGEYGERGHYNTRASRQWTREQGETMTQKYYHLKNEGHHAD